MVCKRNNKEGVWLNKGKEHTVLGLLILFRTDRLISKVSISVPHCMLRAS